MNRLGLTILAGGGCGGRDREWPSGRRHVEGHAAIGPASGRTLEGVVVKLCYLVQISKDPDGDWGASVPDLPGCVATGKTLDTALRRVEAAIWFHLHGLREDGESIPRPCHRVVKPTRSKRRVEYYATVEVAA